LELNLGIRLASYRLPFAQALTRAAQLGVQTVEIDGRHQVKPQDVTRTATRQIRKMLEDSGLRVCAVEFPTRRGYNVRDDLDRRLEATRQAMTMAYALGARVVVNDVGQIPVEPEGDQWQLLIDALSDLGRHGQRCGAMLAARTGAESGQDLARLIAALPDGSLGVAFDPGALLVNGFSPSDALTALGPHLIHAYASDAVRDLGRGRGVATPLGQGAVDYAELLGHLEEQNYHGNLVLEAAGTENPDVELRQSVKYLRQLG
jgi:sugar phosphate isomerase/epimerase